MWKEPKHIRSRPPAGEMRTGPLLSHTWFGYRVIIWLRNSQCTETLPPPNPPPPVLPSPTPILSPSLGQLNDIFLMWELFRAEVGKPWTLCQICPLLAFFFVRAAAKNGFHIFTWLEKIKRRTTFCNTRKLYEIQIAVSVYRRSVLAPSRASLCPRGLWLLQCWQWHS